MKTEVKKIVKVFITIELEGEEVLNNVVPIEAYRRLMDTVDMLRLESIPVQYKETNLPRYKPQFRILGKDIES